LDRDLPDLVVVGQLPVVMSTQDLQIPEDNEQNGAGNDDGVLEHGHARLSQA
jgi:hypothetical protein